MNSSLALLQLLLINAVTSCFAWGAIGHEIVGNIAYNMLSGSTRAAVTDILFPDGYTSDDNVTSPIAAVANWADKVRYTKAFAWTTPLHYVDVMDAEISGGCHPQGNCTFVYERDCQNDKCAVGAIVKFTHSSIGYKVSGDNDVLVESVWVDPGLIRGSKKVFPATDESIASIMNVTQRESLMFLIHIIGDVHQPLHVSRASDKGGNTIHVDFPDEFDGHLDQYGNAHKKWNLQ